jgi:pimeloyl-ACP methyl ester carboxylesterase
VGEARSVLLVHGAGSGPWVFDGWRGAFGDVETVALDLHAGLQIAEASMQNYEAAVAATAGLLERPLVIVGWSMGGLAAMMAARRVEPEALVLLEPSPPAEIQGYDDHVEPAPGTFDPEEVYGPFPPGVAKRPESALARAERKRGVPVRRLPNRTIVVYGREFPDERGRLLAAHYGVDAKATGADHWELVLGPEARTAAAGFLSA